MDTITSKENYEDIYKFIEDWKEKDGDELVDTLKKIKIMIFPSQQISKAKQIINQFHRQLITAGNIEEKTLELVFEVKDHIKKLEEKGKNKLSIQPKMQKKVSVTDVEVPKNYGNALPPNRKTMLHNLYKHFLFNIRDKQNHENLQKFIVDVEMDIFKISQGTLDIYNRQIKKICTHFVQQSSISAKLRMLDGKVLAKDVALNKSQAFLSDQARQKIQQNLEQQSIIANIDFFAEHRKKIHSKSSEQCRFCKAKAAYCWSMKQMRAADEPMTRFMKCQKCDRDWKD